MSSPVCPPSTRPPIRPPTGLAAGRPPPASRPLSGRPPAPGASVGRPPLSSGATSTRSSTSNNNNNINSQNTTPVRPATQSSPSTPSQQRPPARTPSFGIDFPSTNPPASLSSPPLDTSDDPSARKRQISQLSSSGQSSTQPADKRLKSVSGSNVRPPTPPTGGNELTPEQRAVANNQLPSSVNSKVYNVVTRLDGWERTHTEMSNNFAALSRVLAVIAARLPITVGEDSVPVFDFAAIAENPAAFLANNNPAAGPTSGSANDGSLTAAAAAALLSRDSGRGPLSYRDVVTLLVQAIPNPDKDAVRSAMQSLRPPPRPNPANILDPSFNIETSSHLRLLQVAGFDRQPIKSIKANLFTLNFQLSRIRNLSWIGANTLEFLVDKDYSRPLIRDIERIPFLRNITDYDYLKSASNPEPSPEELSSIWRRVKGRLLTETSDGRKERNFFIGMIGELEERLQLPADERTDLTVSTTPYVPPPRIQVDRDLPSGSAGPESYNPNHPLNSIHSLYDPPPHQKQPSSVASGSNTTTLRQPSSLSPLNSSLSAKSPPFPPPSSSVAPSRRPLTSSSSVASLPPDDESPEVEFNAPPVKIGALPSHHVPDIQPVLPPTAQSSTARPPNSGDDGRMDTS